ncbi:hypothetical protein ACHAWC_002720 [Mediolabrus comicus]
MTSLRSNMLPYNLSSKKLAALLAAVIIAATATDAFVAPKLSRRCGLNSEESATSSSSKVSSTAINIEDKITINDKIELRDPTPDERGKGGVQVVAHDDSSTTIKALEVLARIPRNLILASTDVSPRIIDAVSEAKNITWATGLTAVTLAALHPTDDDEITASSGDTDAQQIKKAWIQSWKSGGWGSPIDLGPDIAGDVVGTLITTGSDNDHNIYAKFRMPCHPAIMKASLGLSFLTKCTEEEARDALTTRGFTYRSMRDSLQELVLESTERTSKGTVRDKRCWDVGDTLDRVLARATTLQLEDGETTAIVPIHERLAHSCNANSNLVAIDDEILLVATRDIEAGECITRDYNLAPRITGNNDDSSLTGEGLSALQLLLQFGLPPSAWPES